jgi:hypothetical protein
MMEKKPKMKRIFCITFVDTNIFQTEEVECQDLDKLQQADDEMMTTMTTRVDIGGEGGILLILQSQIYDGKKTQDEKNILVTFLVVAITVPLSMTKPS